MSLPQAAGGSNSYEMMAGMACGHQYTHTKVVEVGLHWNSLLGGCVSVGKGDVVMEALGYLGQARHNYSIEFCSR